MKTSQDFKRKRLKPGSLLRLEAGDMKITFYVSAALGDLRTHDALQTGNFVVFLRSTHFFNYVLFGNKLGYVPFGICQEVLEEPR